MDIETLKVQKRDAQSKKANRRMRNAGQIPAVLYGHGEENVCLAVCAEQFAAALRHGSHMVKLAGDVNDSALIKECQWDVWGNDVLHIDFTRVSLDERIHATVSIELRGEAPGMKEGGVVTHVLHELEIECKAAAIPEKIEVSINHLAFDQTLTVADLTLPEGVVAVTDAHEAVVQCLPPVEVSEEEEAAGDDEPEVIGAKKEEETED